MQPTNDPAGTGSDQDHQEIVLPPNGRHLEYFYSLGHGRYVYVSADDIDFLELSFKLFIGPGDSMREVEILDVVLHDDASSYISTLEGVLYLPSKLDPAVGAAWACQGDIQQLEPLDPDMYDINETAEGVTITKK
jgi:hypothetical protein